MISKEEYEYYQQFRPNIDLFIKTGSYVGGCDSLFDYKKVVNKGCSTCLSQALIEVNNAIQEYERSMQSM